MHCCSNSKMAGMEWWFHSGWKGMTPFHSGRYGMRCPFQPEWYDHSIPDRREWPHSFPIGMKWPLHSDNFVFSAEGHNLIGPLLIVDAQSCWRTHYWTWFLTKYFSDFAIGPKEKLEYGPAQPNLVPIKYKKKSLWDKLGIIKGKYKWWIPIGCHNVGLEARHVRYYLRVVFFCRRFLISGFCRKWSF